MPPKKGAVGSKRVRSQVEDAGGLEGDTSTASFSNLQAGNLYESRHMIPKSVYIMDDTIVTIGTTDHGENFDIPNVISVRETMASTCMMLSGDNECNVAHNSSEYIGLKLSAQVMVLIFKTVLVCIQRRDLSVLSEIPIDPKFSSTSHSVCLHNDVIVLVSESTTNLIPYGGQASPAALHCSIVSATTGDVIRDYEVPFGRVAYFSTTLRTYCSKDKLMISCWDDMQLKVVDLHTGVELFTLERDEDGGDGLEASVTCVASSDEYIAVGYEWQRFIKACPLRVYSAYTGKRLHFLAANGATPQCLSIHADQKILFSSAQHQKEIKVWDLVSGTRLYSIPSVEKIAHFSLSSLDSLFVRSNEAGYLQLPSFHGGVLTAAADALSVWKWDVAPDQLLEQLHSRPVEDDGVIISRGKVLKQKK